MLTNYEHYAMTEMLGISRHATTGKWTPLFRVSLGAPSIRDGAIALEGRIF